MLDWLKNWLTSQGQAQQNRPSSYKWIMWIICSLTALFGVGLLLYKLWAKSREIAKLQHDKDVANEQAAEILANKQISDDKVDIAKSAEIIKGLKQRIIDIDNQLASKEAEEKEINDKIKSIKSWGDVDALLGVSKPTKEPGTGN